MQNLEFENFEMEDKSENKISDEQRHVDYSLKIMSCLEAKVSDFNNGHEDSRINLEQLKTVFINAASNQSDKHSINEWSMARVNMFLSIKGGRKIAFAENIVVDHLSDASLLVIPEEEDFVQAKEDIKAHGLDFEIEIEYLYLEEEGKNETLDFNWE